MFVDFKIFHMQRFLRIVHFTVSPFLIKGKLFKKLCCPSMALFAMQIRKRYTQGILVLQPS